MQCNIPMVESNEGRMNLDTSSRISLLLVSSQQVLTQKHVSSTSTFAEKYQYARVHREVPYGIPLESTISHTLVCPHTHNYDYHLNMCVRTPFS